MLNSLSKGISYIEFKNKEHNPVGKNKMITKV